MKEMKELQVALKQIGCKIQYADRIEGTRFRINGLWRSNGFIIDCKPKRDLSLTLNDSSDWGTAISVLSAVCSNFIGTDAICQYDRSPIQELKSLHVMEWILVDPESHLRVLANGGGVFSESIPSSNLIFFGGRKISDYEDAELQAIYTKEKRLRTDFPGVFGKDPGGCDMVRIERSSDLGLFLEYCVACWQAEKYAAESKTSKISSGMQLAALCTESSINDYILKQKTLTANYILAVICERNNIPTSEPSSEHELEVDECLVERWADFYDKGLSRLYTKDEVAQISRRHMQGEDISRYTPPGDWRA